MKHKMEHKMQRGMGKRMEQMSSVQRCPLSGAAKAIASIEGAIMLIIGTEECSYYTKSSLDMGERGDCCYSVVVDKQDVTFGCGEKVASAVEELLSETKPTALFLVTTCVLEIIGEDYQALAQETQEKYKIPVHIISTNHYSGKDGEHGFELVEEATGNRIQRGKMGNLVGNPRGGGSIMGKLGSIAQRITGKGQGGRPSADMSEEQMMDMMRQKMGGHMSEEEMRAKIQSRMGGGGRR
ncbi:MAG: nitrogenase component 1 [Eubacteriales bacterium]